MDKFIFAFISIRRTFVKSCLCARPDEIFIRSGTQRKGRRTQSRSRSPESKSALTSSGVRKSESRQGVSQGISQGVSQLVSTLSRRHGNKIFIRYCRALLFDIINKSHESVNTTLRGRATSNERRRQSCLPYSAWLRLLLVMPLLLLLLLVLLLSMPCCWLI